LYRNRIDEFSSSLHILEGANFVRNRYAESPEIQPCPCGNAIEKLVESRLSIRYQQRQIKPVHFFRSEAGV
jgi:hypothetical protein